MSDKKPRADQSDIQKKPSTQDAGDGKALNNPDEEYGGFKAQNLPEPTRFNDWEVKGRCSDF